MMVAFQDDMEVWRNSVAKILKNRGCRVHTYIPEDSIDVEQANQYDVIIMDNIMGNTKSGYERLCELRSGGYQNQLILYTATPDDILQEPDLSQIHIVSKKAFIDVAMRKLGLSFT